MDSSRFTSNFKYGYEYEFYSHKYIDIYGCP